MLPEHIYNLSHLVETLAILGLTHMNVTHTITHRNRQNCLNARLRFRVVFWGFFFPWHQTVLKCTNPPFRLFFDSIYVHAHIIFRPLPLLNPITIAAAAI